MYNFICLTYLVKAVIGFDKTQTSNENNNNKAQKVAEQIKSFGNQFKNVHFPATKPNQNKNKLYGAPTYFNNPLVKPHSTLINSNRFAEILRICAENIKKAVEHTTEAQEPTAPLSLENKEKQNSNDNNILANGTQNEKDETVYLHNASNNDENTKSTADLQQTDVQNVNETNNAAVETNSNDPVDNLPAQNNDKIRSVEIKI